jgi:hypothetical protein
VIKALTGRHSFQPGTNLAAWLFRIQRNEFISGLRRQRPTVPVDTAIAESLSHPPHQDSGLVMREFVSAFAKLAPTQREALAAGRARGPALRGHRPAHRRVGGTVKSRIAAPAIRSSACCWKARPSRVRPAVSHQTRSRCRRGASDQRVIPAGRRLRLCIVMDSSWGRDQWLRRDPEEWAAFPRRTSWPMTTSASAAPAPKPG